MNCHTHPDRPVARECRLCHELICSECVVLVGEDAVCKSCVAESFTINARGRLELNQAKRHDLKKQEAVNMLKQKSETLVQEQKSGFLTVLFSCLPGLGHYYLGLQKRGLNMMIVFFLIIFLDSLVRGNLNFPASVAIFILWFYSQFDALKYRSLLNHGETVEDLPLFPAMSRLKTTTWFGLLLAVFGGLALFSNLMNFLFSGDPMMRSIITETLLAIVLVGVGIWILRGNSLPLKTISKEESDEQTNA